MFFIILLSILLFNRFWRLIGVWDGLVMFVLCVMKVCFVYLISKCIMLVLVLFKCWILLYKVKIMSDVIFCVGVGKL